MPVFRYTAVDAAAATRKGELSADSARAARGQLHDRGWTLLDVGVVRERGNPFGLLAGWWRRAAGKASAGGGAGVSGSAASGGAASGGRPVRMKPVATLFLRELSTLLQVGMPMLPALDTVIRQQPAKHRADWMLLRERVSGGGSLAAAMAEASRGGGRVTRFDAVTLAMVEVGEDAGRLGPVLEETAAYRERLGKLRSRLGSALIYPAVVGVVGVLVCLFLMTYVVPQVTEPLLDAGVEPPRLTRWVMGVSDLLVAHGWWVVPAVSLGFFGLAAATRTRRGSRLWHRALLRMPLLGQVLVKQAVVRIAFVISTLMRSGVPFERALGIARSSVKNAVLRDALAACEDAVRAGQDLGPALEASGAFPPTAVQVFALGQESGNLEDLLDRLADGYDSQVSTLVDRLTALVEPVLILALAVAVGIIAFATVLPILQVGKDL